MLGRSLVSAIVSRTTGRISCGPICADLIEGQLRSLNEHPVDYLFTTLGAAQLPELQAPTNRAGARFTCLRPSSKLIRLPSRTRSRTIDAAPTTTPAGRRRDDPRLARHSDPPRHSACDLPAARAAVAIWLGVAYVATHPKDPLEPLVGSA